MIKTTNVRRNGGTEHHLSTSNRSVAAALNHFLEFEIGFGGYITEVDKKKVVIVTHVMGSMDTTTFEADTEEEFIPFLEVTAVWAAIKHDGAKDKGYDLLVDEVMNVTKGNPLKIKLASGMIIGSGILKMILLTLVLEKTGIESLEKLKSLKNKDLFALYDLICIQKQPVEDALSLV